jgi:NitT/TauT family transport system substrate-binding protein
MLRGSGSRGWRMLLAGLVTAIVVAGCGGDDDGEQAAQPTADKPVNITVGTLPIANAAPLYLGMEKGFFKQEGLSVKPQVGEAGGAAITAILSGDVQFGFVGLIPSIVARAKGLPIRIAAWADGDAATPSEAYQVLVVRKDSDIRDVSDLAGKTIAVNALRSVAEVAIRESLSKQGVDHKTIKLLEVPFPEMPAALQARRVDVILAAEPFLSQVLAQGAREIDAPFVTVEKNFAIGVYAISEEYEKKNPAVVDRFVRAMNRSVQYAADNPDEVRRILPTFTQIPKAAAEKMRLAYFSPEIRRDSFDLQAGLTQKYGIIESPPEFDELIREPPK